MLANDVWEALLGAHATLMKQFAAEDIWTEVSMREYDVLYTLSKCSDPVNITELNRHVLLSQPALSRLVERLTARGYLARKPDPRDARGVLLTLTGKGRATQKQVGRRHARTVARTMTAALTSDDLTQLAMICGKLSKGATR